MPKRTTSTSSKGKTKATGRTSKGKSSAVPSAVPAKDSSPVTPERSRSADIAIRKRARNHPFGAEEIDRGLVALALASGNAEQASDALAEQGLKIAPRTLRTWRNKTHDRRYLELQQEILPQLRARAADRHMELADQAGRVNAKLINRLDEVRDELPPRDLPGAVRNLATSAGIDRDKAALLRGEATEIVTHHRSGDEVLRQLKARGVGFFPHIEAALDASAEEIPPRGQGHERMTVYRVKVEIPGSEERLDSGPIPLAKIPAFYAEGCRLMLEEGWVDESAPAPDWALSAEEDGVERDATEAEYQAADAKFASFFGE